MELRDGSVVEDQRLGRIQQFDERSRNFPIRSALGPRKPRSYTWRPPAPLDQGREGSCVGHAWAHEIGARPVVGPSTSELAIALYRRAQQIDPWPGEAPAYEGTSVLAGVHAAMERSWYTEYRWAFSLDEMVLGVGHGGPVVIGVNWHEGMFATDARGYIHPTGKVLGGHAIVVFGVSVRDECFKLLNSWGPGWGRKGVALIGFDGMKTLLAAGGECCLPVRRTLGR